MKNQTMNKHSTVIKTCKHHGETEFYDYPYLVSPRCKECTRERRRSRKFDPKKAKIDKDYNKKWSSENREHLKELSKKRHQEFLNNLEDEKEWLFIDRIDDLRKLFKLYRPTKEYTDLELVNMSIGLSKSLKQNFSWDAFVQRMKNKTRQNLYMNEFMKLKVREGWVKTGDCPYENNYPNAPESEKIRMREEALRLTEERFNLLTFPE